MPGVPGEWSTPSAVDALPCGSRSTTRTESPPRARPAARLTERRGLADAALLVGDDEDARSRRSGQGRRCGRCFTWNDVLVLLDRWRQALLGLVEPCPTRAGRARDGGRRAGTVVRLHGSSVHGDVCRRGGLRLWRCHGLRTGRLGPLGRWLDPGRGGTRVRDRRRFLLDAGVGSRGADLRRPVERFTWNTRPSDMGVGLHLLRPPEAGYHLVLAYGSDCHPCSPVDYEGSRYSASRGARRHATRRPGSTRPAELGDRGTDAQRPPRSRTTDVGSTDG